MFCFQIPFQDEAYKEFFGDFPSLGVVVFGLFQQYLLIPGVCFKGQYPRLGVKGTLVSSQFCGPLFPHYTSGVTWVIHFTLLCASFPSCKMEANIFFARKIMFIRAKYYCGQSPCQLASLFFFFCGALYAVYKMLLCSVFMCWEAFFLMGFTNLNEEDFGTQIRIWPIEVHRNNQRCWKTNPKAGTSLLHSIGQQLFTLQGTIYWV